MSDRLALVLFCWGASGWIFVLGLSLWASLLEKQRDLARRGWLDERAARLRAESNLRAAQQDSTEPEWRA